jgi:DnaJ-class molecular chaperone
MAEEARRNPPPRDTSSSSSQRSSAGSSRSSRRPSIFQNKDLAQHYKTLEVDYGADAATVKKAYRKLMRKYHPDLPSDPKKKKAATNLTVKISAAYAAIEQSRK